MHRSPPIYCFSKKVQQHASDAGSGGFGLNEDRGGMFGLTTHAITNTVSDSAPSKPHNTTKEAKATFIEAIIIITRCG